MNDYLPVPNSGPCLETRQAVIRGRLVDCRICLGPHDEEIHAATVSVRQWFREEVTKSFQPIPVV